MTIKEWLKRRRVRNTLGALGLAAIVAVLWYIFQPAQQAPQVASAPVSQPTQPLALPQDLATKAEVARVQENVGKVERQLQELKQTTVGVQTDVDTLKKTVPAATATTTTVTTQATPAPPSVKPAPPKVAPAPPKKVATANRPPRKQTPSRASGPPVQLTQRSFTPTNPTQSDGWTSGSVLFDQARCRLGRTPENPNNCS